jgi:hypothetical protein
MISSHTSKHSFIHIVYSLNLIFSFSLLIAEWSSGSHHASSLAHQSGGARGFNHKGSPYRTLYACEGSSLEIACEEGSHINLIRANFGRFSISVCNEHGNVDWSVDCMSHRSFAVIKER